MKKLLAGLLSAAMVFTLAGCGSSKDHLATIQDKGEITIHYNINTSMLI